MSAPLLAARHVARAYGPVHALRDASLTARRGEVLALIGPSGAGKSTLLRLLHGLEGADAGEVHLDGAPLPAKGPARLAAVRRLALVQQKPGFLQGSARENVAFPLRARGTPRAEALARADALLARFGLTARAHAPARHLSGGEAQRAALARALIARPDGLLLDEFTNQLDPDNEEAAERAVLAERARGAAVVVVTHRVAQVRRLADRVAFLHEGRVMEEGPARDVLEAPRDPLLARFLSRA